MRRVGVASAASIQRLGQDPLDTVLISTAWLQYKETQQPGSNERKTKVEYFQVASKARLTWARGTFNVAPNVGFRVY
jgi:hypothetical protein